jgi:tetratricopeptide (TPR) repeat protein
MRATPLKVVLLLSVAFCLATWLLPRFETLPGRRPSQAGLMASILGESRRLFAGQLYLKADVYLHAGFYPSIFDDREKFNELRNGRTELDPEEAHVLAFNFLGKPKDWLDRFSRNFYPSEHRHIGESGHHDEPGGPVGHAHDAGDPVHDAGDAHDDDHSGAKGPAGLEREILPWLKFSAELDPERIDTYVVAAYWLRTKLNKSDEAEQFLREGLQANPGNAELLFELGRVFMESRNNADRARNIWEMALAGWRKSEEAKSREEQNILLYAQILGNLVKLEFEQKNFAKSLEYLALLKEVSPNQAGMKKWEEDIKAAMSR